MGNKMIIVYAYVCADILNVGHLLHLRNSKELGDKLIVGVLTQEAIMEKKSKPILSLSDRISLIKALGFVDCVVAQDDYSLLKNVKNIKPDILVESDSHKIQPANKYVESYGGRVISMPYYPESSSSGIKRKIKESKQ